MKTMDQISEALPLLPDQLERAEDIFGARSSGRTYAMLAQALYWAQYGKVVVLGCNYPETVWLWEEMRRLSPQAGVDISNLKLNHYCHIGGEAKLMSLDIPILLDHYRVELTFGDAIVLMLALDSPLPLRTQLHFLNRLHPTARLYRQLLYRCCRGRLATEQRYQLQSS